MTRSTPFGQIALALAAASLTTLCAAADPIKIGVAGPFTGGSSSRSTATRRRTNAACRSRRS